MIPDSASYPPHIFLIIPFVVGCDLIVWWWSACSIWWRMCWWEEILWLWYLIFLHFFVTSLQLISTGTSMLTLPPPVLTQQGLVAILGMQFADFSRDSSSGMSLLWRIFYSSISMSKSMYQCQFIIWCVL